jgi:hypothetical protein
MRILRWQGRRKKEEGRRKKEEGRRKKEEVRAKGVIADGGERRQHLSRISNTVQKLQRGARRRI